ncbi:hypothetical protein Pla123a_08480 [Posidoniimonas polymericola]|uniref:DUF2267 domain-containing protein n=1 Tax=Posidoniimonas polymericola TaxID=2528002 RepID=A0A5C5YSW8_9BACT|nr:DUF2780 domain-containing protein [Posidoniimonas polymericola]TWT78059.1 hypothetical protein Pla123a_08480 [Posidoniimonas polymericola]
MNELIQQISKQLGIDESTAAAATGKAMSMLREHVGDDLFGKINAAVPDASQMADQASAKPAGGLMGSLASMASSALGGDAGSGLELSAALASTGLPIEKLGPFVTTLIGYLKQYLGDDVIEQVLEKFPMLKAAIGE